MRPHISVETTCKLSTTCRDRIICFRKKSNSIFNHAVCESVAMGETFTSLVSTHHNPADICKKVLPGGQKRDYLTGLVLYDLADQNSD